MSRAGQSWRLFLSPFTSPLVAPALIGKLLLLVLAYAVVTEITKRRHDIHAS